MKGGREKILVTREHTGLYKAMGGNVQCTDGESVQGEKKHELAALFTPDTPKLVYVTHFQSPTFVN